MDRAKLIRRVRIAASGFCFLACILLTVLWIRSHYWIDVIRGQIVGNTAIQFVSTKGQLLCSKFPSPNHIPWQRCGVSESAETAKRDSRIAAFQAYIEQLQARAALQIDFRKMEVENAKRIAWIEADIETIRVERKYVALSKHFGSSFTLALPHFRFGFGLQRSNNGYLMGCPHWAVVAVCAAIGTAIAIRTPWQFSLRTLLIATTLLAFVLGVIVIAAR
jgi:hypothetical protein